MRKLFYIAFLILGSHVCHSQSILEVKINTPESGKVILYNTKSQKIDTLQFSNGFFSFHDELESSTLFNLFLDGFNNERPMTIVLSSEKTVMSFDSLRVPIEGNTYSDLYPNQPHFVKDPNKNQAFYKFHKAWVNFSDSIVSLSSSDSEELFEKRKALYHSFLQTCDSLIQENKNDFISATIIQYLINNQLLQLETIQSFYDHLAQNVKDNFMGLKIGEYAGKAGRVQPGQAAPEFDFVDIKGKEFSLSKLKGKKVLLHFWSSTCGPCIKEAPDLIRLNEEFENQLITLNISLDTDKARWLKGIERAGIGEMNNSCDLNGFRGKIAQDYSINVVPAYYLIDEDGQILVKGSLNQVTEEIKKVRPNRVNGR